jgi:Tol biopolymer transport system component
VITGMGGIENPDFSPDSRHLTFSGIAPGPCPGICIGESQSHTYVARVDGGGVRAIGTGLAGFNSENPQWVR